MKKKTLSWPLDNAEHLLDALREQGSSEDEAQELSKAMIRLVDWQTPTPSEEDTRQLIKQLTPYLARVSPIREAIGTQSGGFHNELSRMLRLVLNQVSLFHVSFWLASAVVVLVGGLLLFSGLSVNQSLLLQIIGPLLSYLGTATAFRGNRLHMLEFELACPPSPRQLTLARLIIILGYDISLGLGLTLLLWSNHNLAIWLLILNWLAPLMLGAGLTLLLSLRIPVNQAAAISYVGWLALLVSALISQNGIQSSASVFSNMTELGFGLAGCLMICIVVVLTPKSISNLLPGA